VAEVQTVRKVTQIMAHVNSSFPLTDTRQIAQNVHLPSLMRHLGWRVQRGEKRADCGLCKGNSGGTVALSREGKLWRCHRCQAGGDAFTLIMQTERCDFPQALRYVANYAGISVPTRSDGADYRRVIERKRQERERIDRSVEYLADMERELRLDCRDKVHECDRILTRPGPWDESQWQRARWAQVLQREFLLPEYTLLAFGNTADRVRYILASGAERASICGTITMVGGVRTDSSQFMETMG
jgi:hypothetical protein